MLGQQQPARRFRAPTAVLALRHLRGSEAGEEAGAGAAAAAMGAAGRGNLGLGAAVPAVAVPNAGLGSGAGSVSVAGGELGGGAAGQAEEPVVLYFGIIDFLQEYNWRKRAEHGLKAVLQDKGGISVVDPRSYARRFMRCMQRVFRSQTSGGDSGRA